MVEIVLVGPRSGPLQAVQRVVDAQASAWTMRWCVDDTSALDAIASRPADVVVASGAAPSVCEALFRRLREGGHRALRIACLPGEHQRVIGAHQVLTGQASAEVQASALHAVAEVAAHAADHDGLRNLLAQFRDVPSPPLLYFDLREHLDSKSGSAAGLARIASRDAAVVARTLEIANSGFYARPKSVGSLVTAINLIGADALLAIVLATQVFAGLPPPGLRLESMWRHAAAVAALAKRLCELDGGDREQAGHSYLAGLLHDLGLLVLLQNEASRYSSLLQQSRGIEHELVVLERALFGLDHGELGAAILQLWMLPDDVVSAVANSHGQIDPSAEPMAPAGRAVFTAEWLLGLDPEVDEHTPPVELGDADPASVARWVAARDELSSTAPVL